MGSCSCSVAASKSDEGHPLQPCFPNVCSKVGDIHGCSASSREGPSVKWDLANGQRDSQSAPLRRRSRGLLTWHPDDPDSSDNELAEEPKDWFRKGGARRGACCAETFEKGRYFKERYWNKTGRQKKIIYDALRSLDVFEIYGDELVEKLVHAVEIHMRVAGSSVNEVLAEQGDICDGLFVVLSGSVVCYDRHGVRKDVHPQGSVVDELAILWGVPRKWTMKAEPVENEGVCTFGKLRREDCINICLRFEHEQRQRRQVLLQRSKLLEMMEPEAIAKLADVLKTRTYNDGDDVIRQGEDGNEFFIVTKGEAIAIRDTAGEEQEVMRYQEGGTFGEIALMKNTKRGATIRAVTDLEVMILTRRQFERLFGSMQTMQEHQYLTDPRTLIADFYNKGDSRGPHGTLQLRRRQEPDLQLEGESTWFAVYRPTSTAAIALMLSGVAVGKGLNVKGKSAKQGILSGFVPFVQISDNEHKKEIEDSPKDARLTVYYKTRASRDEARKALEKALPMLEGDVDDPSVIDEDNYVQEGAPTSVWGLNLPEKVLREVYIMSQDLSPVLGWETGRRSEPFNMDANLHAVRDGKPPKVVIYQHDEGDAMNPRGLLVAYAEKFVKPVVSDFDTFLVGSRGMRYDSLIRPQAEVVKWLLEKMDSVLSSADGGDWTKRWMKVLKSEAPAGGHYKLPELGYGDPTSYRLTEDVIEQTIDVGAIRHGAECCNFGFPQELDDQYLVVWHGYHEEFRKPWHYLTEPDLRGYLIERVKEG